MNLDDKISDYVTFPRTFDNYRWYKPILVFIVSFIIALILAALIIGVFYIITGPDFLWSIMRGGYEVLTSPLAILFTDLIIIVFISS